MRERSVHEAETVCIIPRGTLDFLSWLFESARPLLGYRATKSPKEAFDETTSDGRERVDQFERMLRNHPEFTPVNNGVRPWEFRVVFDAGVRASRLHLMSSPTFCTERSLNAGGDGRIVGLPGDGDSVCSSSGTGAGACRAALHRE